MDAGVLPLSTSLIELVTLQPESWEFLRCQGAIPIRLLGLCETTEGVRPPSGNCMLGREASC